MKISKTNAVRLLDKIKTEYRLLEYPIHEEHLDAMQVAATLNINPENVFKTLVLKGSSNPYLVAVIPANTNLDLKKFAKVSDQKSCEMLPLKNLLSVTGYVRGGCSPIGMKKKFPTYIEKSAGLHKNICINAGKRGLQLIISPTVLCELTDAKLVEIT